MRFRLPQTTLAAAIAALSLVVFAAPAARAFTVENKDAAGSYEVPKFNLEEQAKNFRKDGSGSPSGAKQNFETPLGPGTLHFGVQDGPRSGFGMGSGFGPANGSRAGRADFERMVTPDNLR